MEEIEIKVTVEDLQVIGMGLAELPFKTCHAVMDKLNRQYAEYTQKKSEQELKK